MQSHNHLHSSSKKKVNVQDHMMQSTSSCELLAKTHVFFVAFEHNTLQSNLYYFVSIISLNIHRFENTNFSEDCFPSKKIKCALKAKLFFLFLEITHFFGLN